jgi:hypothetical protein
MASLRDEGSALLSEDAAAGLNFPAAEPNRRLLPRRGGAEKAIDNKSDNAEWI